MGVLATGAVSGALIGPLIGGFLADQYGLRPVFLLPQRCCLSAFCHAFLCQRTLHACFSQRCINEQTSFASLRNKNLVISLFLPP